MVSTTDKAVAVELPVPVPVSALMVRPKPSLVVRAQWVLVLAPLVVAMTTGGDWVSLYMKAVWAPNGEVVVDGRKLPSYPMEAVSPLGPEAEVGARALL